MSRLIPGVRDFDVPDEEEVYILEKISPFVRQAGYDIRGRWFIKERRIADFLIVYIESGEGVFNVAEKEFNVGSGDFIWIPPGIRHQMQGISDRMKCLYIHFDLIYDPARSHWDACIPGGTLDAEAFDDIMHPPVTHPVLNSLSGKIELDKLSSICFLMKKICLNFNRKSPYCRIRIKGLMLELLYEVISGRMKEIRSSENPYWSKMQEAAQKIAGNGMGILNIEDLASEYNLSESHFRLLFKQVHGCTPGKMHKDIKFRLATEMLVYTDKPLSVIADELHFSNVNNFSRAFRNKTGISPGRYRKSVK
jgi:AraC-like DNA-binding protein